MIEVKKLCKVYEDSSGKVQALDNVSFSLPTKGMVFIVGKSGCGKTTLLNILGGLDNLTSGEVLVNRKSLASFSVGELDNYRNSTIGFVFQDFCLIDRMSVKNNIKMSLEFQSSIKKVNYKDLLQQFGLTGLARRKPTQLSAGQKQRVAIARAIVKDPEIILADEPTGNVDEKTSRQIMDILKKISDEKLVVVISHNNDEAYKYADRIIEMSDGKIISDKILNKNSSEKLLLTTKEVILPGNGEISDVDLEIMNNVVRKSEGKIKITQNESLYIEKAVPKTDESIPLRKAKMSNFTKFKYAGFFFRKKFVFNLFIILLITFVTSFFSIVEILGFADNNKEFDRMLNERNYEHFDLTRHTRADALPMENSNLEEVAANYGVEFDYVYNIAIPTAKISTSYTAYSVPFKKYYSASSIITTGLIKETTGVAVTNKERLQKIFDSYTLLAGEIKETGDGVIMTDYAADCIISFQPETFTSYQDIVDAGYINNTLDIDAIIKTDLYDKYPDLLTNWSKYKSDSNLKHRLCNQYAYCYSLNPNFKQDYLSSLKNVDLTHISIPVIQYASAKGYTTTGSYTNFTLCNDLEEDEIQIHYATYNQYFGGKINYNHLDEFEGDTINITFVDGQSQILLNKTFRVTKLYNRTHYHDTYHISNKLFDSLVRPMTFAYYASIYSEKGNIYNFIDEVISDDEDFFTVRNTEQSLMHATLQLFATFRKIFSFISFLLIGAIFLIIILNANTLIKHNVYEIGLMKAFGAKTRNLVSMFTNQMIFTSLVVCGLLYTSSQLFVNFADDLLKEGIIAYMSTAEGYMNFNTFVFSQEYFWLNIFIIAASTILSVVVPILAIRKIKPLTIIRTRN